MIEIKKKQDCCGCTACASVCPKHCIVMTEDKEGFKYPVVDKNLCVECNGCVNVCPVINAKPAREPIQCYAAINKDKDVLKESSSGGVFSVLAEYVIREKHGVVFGAKWNDEKVVHGYTETMEDVAQFRGSKYVQSDMGDCFSKAKEFLQAGRFVLFSGTPCEISGLISFLKKGYDNLLTVDVACHGVPSPLVLSKYIDSLKTKYNVDTIDINFRDKSTGWSNYSVTAKSGDRIIFSEPAVKQNVFMRGFLHELYSRPSCHECKFKQFRSHSDITLADFWGVENVLQDKEQREGVSLAITHSQKAEQLMSAAQNALNFLKVDTQQALYNNSSLLTSEVRHPDRKYFFNHIHKSYMPTLTEKCLALRKPIRIKLLFGGLKIRIRI